MKELLIRQKIDQVEDALVQQAEQAVDEHPGIARRLEDKQLRNVSAVAAETESLSVVDNFLKYQIGRSKPGEGWRAGADDGFGERVRADLGWIRTQAGALADGQVTARELEIRLARLYFGYLVRHFKYVGARGQPQQGGG
ncbi:MAG: hypothetical protein HY690_18795 [Chloroflexi bacterium]|nr:hypothetical protein [Chloroflexota bacterium]